MALTGLIVGVQVEVRRVVTSRGHSHIEEGQHRQTHVSLGVPANEGQVQVPVGQGDF